MEVVFVFGILATSFAGAFLVYGISYAILNIRCIKMWIKIETIKLNAKRTYKF